MFQVGQWHQSNPEYLLKSAEGGIDMDINHNHVCMYHHQPSSIVCNCWNCVTTGSDLKDVVVNANTACMYMTCLSYLCWGHYDGALYVVFALTLYYILPATLGKVLYVTNFYPFAMAAGQTVHKSALLCFVLIDNHNIMLWYCSPCMRFITSASAARCHVMIRYYCV